MVSKNVLRKLSDAELERYFILGNRFTPEAVEAAFDILTERGHLFSESEEISIRKMILSKKKEEESRTNEEKEFWKDHITESFCNKALFPQYDPDCCLSFRYHSGIHSVIFKSAHSKKIHRRCFNFINWLWIFLFAALYYINRAS